MRREQRLSSGIIVRQNISNCVRAVFYESEGSVYTSDGGTALIVRYKNTAYAITCMHVKTSYDWKQLVITNSKYAKLGSPISGIDGVYKFTPITKHSEDTDLNDLAIIKLTNPALFNDDSYIIDDQTITTSKPQDKLHVYGVLKSQSTYYPQLIPKFCELEYQDNDWMAKDDASMRHAISKFDNPEITNIAGISGSPVYNTTQNKLCGIVVRGGIVNQFSNIYYLDMFDVKKNLEACHNGQREVYYTKDRLLITL